LGGGRLRRWQVCSALQAALRFGLGLAYGHGCAALGQANPWLKSKREKQILSRP